jgi:short-subunit dehydrogenase
VTAALVEHLKHKDDAVIVYTSSVLGFVPLAATAVYSATKAALHSYAMSQRFLLKDSGVRVLEMAPPWVRTDLMNSREAKEAMPLDQFIAETMAVFGTDADETLADAARQMWTSVHDDVALPALTLAHVVKNRNSTGRLHDAAEAAGRGAELGQSAGQATIRQRAILRTIVPVHRLSRSSPSTNASTARTGLSSAT